MDNAPTKDVVDGDFGVFSKILLARDQLGIEFISAL
jgi:hypothetical protein